MSTAGLLDRWKRHYKKGSLFFLEGDPGHEMFIITGGQVLIYRMVAKPVRDGSAISAGQQIQPIATLHEGDFFGEMAILDHQPRSSSAIAHTDVDVLVIEEDNLEAILRAKPEFAVRMLRAMAHRLRPKPAS